MRNVRPPEPREESTSNSHSRRRLQPHLECDSHATSFNSVAFVAANCMILVYRSLLIGLISSRLAQLMQIGITQ